MLENLIETSRNDKLKQLDRQYFCKGIDDLRRRELDWQIFYKQHMSSVEWKKTRAKKLSLNGGICEGCLENRATHVHHTTYEHLGSELMFELKALCTGCHEVIHWGKNLHRPKRDYLEVDGLHCSGCRHYSGMECGIYEIPIGAALHPLGPCGIERTGYEPLK